MREFDLRRYFNIYWYGIDRFLLEIYIENEFVIVFFMKVVLFKEVQVILVGLY